MIRRTTLTKFKKQLAVVFTEDELKKAGLQNDVLIEVTRNSIIIKPMKRKIEVNIDRSTWEAQFKKAIKEGNLPEKCVWPD